MGREIKRVPLDFDWPLNETWAGYLNPFYEHMKDCPSCDGSGYAPEAKRISDQWFGYVEFDPAETGSKPMTTDTPEVRAVAEHNVGNSPGFYGSGELAVIRRDGRYITIRKDELPTGTHGTVKNYLRPVFVNGELLVDEDFASIRERSNNQ